MFNILILSLSIGHVFGSINVNGVRKPFLLDNGNYEAPFTKYSVTYRQIFDVMDRTSFYGEVFSNVQTDWSFDKGEYEECIFEHMQYSTADLSDCIFVNCQFQNCDLSMVNVENTAFRDVQFEACKLIGVRFDTANQLFFEAKFTDCQLRLANFYSWKMPEVIFKHCGLQEVDFGEADLEGAVIEACDLEGAMFEQTNLAHVDFRRSFNFSIDLEKNKIQYAKFSKESIGGLLDKYDLTIE